MLNTLKPQPLRHYDVILSVSGTPTVKPTKLYQGSYGFTLLRCFVPVTQNHEFGLSTPTVCVYKTVTNEMGETVVDGKAYPLFYVETTKIDGYDYLLFEAHMPKPFTKTVGQLSMRFVYKETSEIIAENILVATVHTEVYQGSALDYETVTPDDGDYAGKLNNLTAELDWVKEDKASKETVQNVANNVEEVKHSLKDYVTIDYFEENKIKGNGTVVTVDGKPVETFNADEKANVEMLDDYVTKEYFEENKGSGGGGTTVTVGGEVVEIFDADTKLNKLNKTYSFIYTQTEKGNVNDKPYYSTNGSKEITYMNGSIPVYYGQNLYSGVPSQPYQTANKKYVDERIQWIEVDIDADETSEWELPNIPDTSKYYMLTIQVNTVGSSDIKVDLIGLIDNSEYTVLENFVGCIDAPYFDCFANGSQANCLGEIGTPYTMMYKGGSEVFTTNNFGCAYSSENTKLKLKITKTQNGYSYLKIRYKLEEVKYE